MNSCDRTSAASFFDYGPGGNADANRIDNSDPLWASTPVNWSSSLMDFGLEDAIPAPLSGAESWAVPHSDLLATQDPFALEIRAEIIEQLVSGQALRRGDIEKIAVGRSRGNVDIVVGRDHVRVGGELLEHTGQDLGVRASHVETTVDGNVDADVKQGDAVRVLGNLIDVWHGGMTVTAATTGDMLYGGGIRCSAPLSASVAGLTTRGMTAGFASADGVLTELCGTLFDRESGTGIHHAQFATQIGSLYVAERPGFLPLMRMAMGVRNLVAGADADTQDASSDSSPPPAEEGSDTTSLSSTGSTISSGSTASAGSGSAAAGTSGTAVGGTAP